MTKEEILNKINELAEKYPDVAQIIYQYRGSGDSFEDFWDHPQVLRNGKRSYDCIDITEVEDLLWEAIDQYGCDFNNDGSEGAITIDLVNKTLHIENYIIVTDTILDGEKDII